MSCFGKLFSLCLIMGSAAWGRTTDQSSPSVTSATSKPTVSPGVIITNSTFVTMVPSSNVKYTMRLNTTGSSVLDSTAIFRAELIPENASSVPFPGKNFIYQWMNMVNMEKQITEGGLSSQISITFSSDYAAAGDYPMTVAAFHKSNTTKIIALETTKFTLTEKLNGHLSLEQNLEYQRMKNVFCTGQNLTITAHVHDHFKKETLLLFSYEWFADDHFLAVTKKQNYTTTFINPTKMTIKSEVRVFVDVNDTNSVTNSNLSQLNSWEQHATETNVNPGKNRGQPAGTLLFKKGQFEHDVVFKDPLYNCSVVRGDSHPDDAGIPLKEGALINITCKGSAPSGVCLNITIHSQNKSIPDNETCKPQVFSDTVQHQIRVFLNSTGWHNINFYIYNDVKRVHIVGYYFGYNKDSGATTTLIVPIVFGTLGIVVILVGAIFIMRLRKKPLVEVADFDFHPSLTSSMQSEASIKITRVVTTIKHMFSRDNYESTHHHPRANSDVTPRPQERPSKQLYESL